MSFWMCSNFCDDGVIHSTIQKGFSEIIYFIYVYSDLQIWTIFAY